MNLAIRYDQQRTPTLVAALCLVAGSACGGTNGSMEPHPDSAVQPESSRDGGRDTDGGVARNALLAEWPVMPVGVESRGFSSFDRAGGNDDGFNGTYSTLYQLPTGEHVIFDAMGPGRLNSFWFTSGESGYAPLDLGRVRIYLDEDTTPRVAAEANTLFSGITPGFPRELVFDNRRSTGGFVSWARILFKGRLRITTEKEPFFYNAQYETFPVDAAVESWRPEVDDLDWLASVASANAPWDEGNGVGQQSLIEIPLEYTHTGGGVLETIVFAPARAPSKAELSTARIQIAWDDEATPAVDVPLGAFFGSGLGEAHVRSVAFRMDPGLYQNRFPMPFWKGFRLRLVGLEGRLRVRVGAQRFEKGRADYFRAVFRETRPTSERDDFDYLAFEGTGKLVGTVLTVEPSRADMDKGWWEGDLRSYADDRRTPGIHGTGHEDDHLGGWSNEFLDVPFTLPLHGAPKTEILDRDGQYNGNATMYRLWPGIPFLRKLAHSVEHGDANLRVVNYAAVTFFYGSADGRLADGGLLRVCDAAARAAAGYTAGAETPPSMLTSAFEGRFFRTGFEACHASHRGPASFALNVPASNAGVYLRRLFDQRAARQAARITVNGQVVGTWYTVEGNESLRWAERDFFIPASFAAGRSSLSIKVEPLSDGPAWDVSEYRALAVKPL